MKRLTGSLALVLASAPAGVLAQTPRRPPSPPAVESPADLAPKPPPSEAPVSDQPNAPEPVPAPDARAVDPAEESLPNVAAPEASPGGPNPPKPVTVPPPAGPAAKADTHVPVNFFTIKRLAPSFGEDRYPGDRPGSPFDAKLTDGDNPWRFSFHGYFRAPLRLTWARRSENTGAGETGTTVRTPYLVDDEYFASGFAYTHVQEQDWSELYLSVGNKQLTGTVSLFQSLFSDYSRSITDRIGGIAQGWVRYRFEPDVAFARMRIGVKAGAFWDRFGWMPKYDTYLFGRVHQLGEQVRIDVEKDRWAFWVLHGFGAHLGAHDAKQGLTYGNYLHAGANYNGVAEVGAYFIDTDTRDRQRSQPELKDADVTVVGLDARVDTGPFGKLYAATSSIQAKNAYYSAPFLEVMHSFGGRGLTENYFGTESSDAGTGSLANFGFQYDLSMTGLLHAFDSETAAPFPWGGDITASAFGMFTHVNSRQKALDPLFNRDGRDAWKWGVEANYRVTNWVGFSVRYDRVNLDVSDSGRSFRLLSPRLTFFTSFLSGEAIYVQYSHYMYGERVQLRPGQVPLETLPDHDVIKMQAQIGF